MSSVTLKNVCKSYEDLPIVKNLDLTIRDGEFVVLVGPSGCGKSTTLRMVAGLEEITDGEVQVGDTTVNSLPPHKRNIAMVFQNYALYPHKSVRENILFGLKKAGASQEVMATKLKEVARMLELEPYLERKPADLSGGQRQRVAMGRALARDAEVYLFDEPLSNLDAKLRHHMRTEIARIQGEYNMTAIYVTHDQVEAMTLGDRVVVMRDGVVEQIGTPMEIFLQPANTFVATFIGSPAMNLIEAEVTPDGVKVGETLLALNRLAHADSASLQGMKKVLVGIRPDFFEDARFLQASDNEPLLLENLPVKLVENLGFDKELLVGIGDQEVKARLDLRSTVKRGQSLTLAVDPKRILLFSCDEAGENQQLAGQGRLLNAGAVQDML
ncbi:ABC transporter ATP-binding protein [Pokkaliibacter sp. CJK22405]|uniref:ABC transporter ATP-binding protein n=1 Tax=Pokkaliibacter sp. CJK22405 TaxID=3384615 RepID=UPI0039846BBE